MIIQPLRTGCGCIAVAALATAQVPDVCLEDRTELRSVASVGTLRAEVPDVPATVVHGTIAIPPRPFDRRSCPYKLVTPAGEELTTQWELVARLKERHIVELRAALGENVWSGPQTFSIIEAENPFNLDGFKVGALALATLPDLVTLDVEAQDGSRHEFSLSGFDDFQSFHRFGSVTLTTDRHVSTPFGSLHVWFTINAHQPQVELILNWHNGELPARPDVFIKALRLQLPGDWIWRPLLPDPAVRNSLLVRPDDHILPQRMERSFRILLHHAGDTPDLLGAWGVGDWSEGGYLAQDAALPRLDHVAIDLAAQREEDFFLLYSTLATQPGHQPVSRLWPAAGVSYGGMTGGIDIEQYPEVPLAASGDHDGLLSLYVDQLRYASRQMGCIYEADGHPIALDAYLNPDGSAPWRIFDNRFLGNPAQDAPFNFSQVPPGTGSAAYEPRSFDPIDLQHLVRRTKANKALVWLCNDPLARLYVRMDAELGRMAYYEGPGGRLAPPATPGVGADIGRAQAWVGDVLAHAYAIGDDAERGRLHGWFVSFADVLRTAQMANGLFSAKDSGKAAMNPPYGDGITPFFWVHRANEQIFLMHALRAAHATVGIDTSDLLRNCGRGLWRFAWKPGTNGPLERYPAGPIGGPRYVTRAEIPAGLTDSVQQDSYHVATAIAHAHLAGQQMLGATLAHTGTSNLAAALNQFESWGLDNIQNRANALALLQQLVEGH